MKSNNQYLESINESVGGQMVDERKPNNWYLRSIAKNTGSEEIHGHRTDNYYLKRIALNMEDLDVKELLETIAELRGEVEDLEEQLSNDIHLFGCCKNIVQTGESLGVFAYCKHDGEVEGNTVHFYAVERYFDSMVVKFTGTSFSSESTDPFVGEDILIDWGDGTVTEYTTGDAFEHTYANNTEHTITIKNVTEVNNNTFYGTDLTDVFVSSNVVSLGRGCFGSCKLLESVTLSEGLTNIGFACFSVCDSLTEITIPSSVTSIGDNCFPNTPLDNINFLWDTSENIISYDSNVYVFPITDYKFTIPTGTTSLYEAKGYPTDKLQER